MVSVKQKLLSQSTVQQAMIEQMKANEAAQATAAPVPAEAATPATAPGAPAPASATTQPADGGTTPPNDAPAAQPVMTVAEIEQQATVQTTQKLADLVSSGLLSMQGTEYVIELNLTQGQLTVNGKPFSPSMMQF